MSSNIKQMITQYQNIKIKEQTLVREILQQAALLGLERHGFFEKAAFYGGTALRILYGLDRFSEDLDFTLLKPTPDFDFTPYLKGVQRELQSFGFEMEVMQKEKSVDTSIVSAFLKMNTIQLYLAIDEKKTKSVNHNEKVKIKLEVDVDPPPHDRVENRAVFNPVPFYVLTLPISDLFAGKMHAILFRAWKGRVKGRDWYDLIWYVRNKIPLSLRYLEACMRQAQTLPPEKTLNKNLVLDMLQKRILTIDWESAKLDVRDFIVDPNVIDIWSPQFFSQLIEQIIID